MFGVLCMAVHRRTSPVGEAADAPTTGSAASTHLGVPQIGLDPLATADVRGPFPIQSATMLDAWRTTSDVQDEPVRPR